MPLGAHMSIAGGVDRAIARGLVVGCEAIQIFTKSNNQWKARPLPQEEIRAFRKGVRTHRLGPTLAHNAYLINLASPRREVYRRSMAAMGVELERADALGIPYLVMHPGAHLGSGEGVGLRRVAGALTELLAARPGRVQVLLETTAGQGTCLGHRFEHLAEIISRVRPRRRVGVCFDTCHVFAAGYDIRTPEGYAEVMEEFADVVGLARLRAFHLNDSKKGLNCRVDRHEHIGRGAIGVEGFRALMKDERFVDRTMVLETPKSQDCHEDVENLALLRSLRGT